MKTSKYTRNLEDISHSVEIPGIFGLQIEGIVISI